MGINGLTTYINDNSDIFFDNYKLKDTRLVIDGNNLAVQIYKTLQNASFLGGDYDVYYEAVKDFFCKLKMCHVEAIVIFDGGMEQKKMGTYFKRCEHRVAILRDFQRKHWKNVFVPVFLQITFSDVLTDLKIKHAKTWFEADQEIASLACFLNCPVLSLDSDFFIFGCLYIPFDKLFYDKLEMDLSTKPASFHMRCMIYNIASLEKHIRGDKSLLMLISTLQGNDYVSCDIFAKFFQHLSIQNSSKVKSVIAWLKNESFESAKSNILKHIRKADAEKALKAIDLTVKSYEIIHPTIWGHLQMDSLESIKDTANFKCGSNLSKLPDKFIEEYVKNKMPPTVINMVNLRKYYPTLPVEDVTRESSHSISFPIVGGIYFLVRKLTGIEGKLKVMLKMFSKFTEISLDFDCKALESFDAKSLISGPVGGKINFMYAVLSFNGSDISRIDKYDEDWKILMMSFVYWLKNSDSDVSETHLHSLVLMILANFVQSKVGHFKNYTHFMQRKAGQLNRLSKTSVDVMDAGNSFSDMLGAITELEQLKLMEKFIKLRQFESEITDPGYFMRTLHVFATFQSVLRHVFMLNQVLGLPLPNFQIHKIYTGTLVYNIYFKLLKKKDIPDFVGRLLETEPNILRVYKFFVSTLIEYAPNGNRRENRTRPAMKSRRRRCRNRKRNK